MTEAKRELLELLKELRKTDPAGFLSVVAVCRVITSREDMEPPPGYNRGDYKRAIKVCREIQNVCPQDADRIEEAVSLIRRNWLHREGVS